MLFFALLSLLCAWFVASVFINIVCLLVLIFSIWVGCSSSYLWGLVVKGHQGGKQQDKGRGRGQEEKGERSRTEEDETDTNNRQQNNSTGLSSKHTREWIPQGIVWLTNDGQRRTQACGLQHILHPVITPWGTNHKAWSSHATSAHLHQKRGRERRKGDDEKKDSGGVTNCSISCRMFTSVYDRSISKPDQR